MLSNARFAAFVAFAVLLGVSPAPQPAPSASPAAGSGDAAYASLAQAYFAESFRAGPVGATAVGVHTYDTQLGSYGAADYAAQIARDHRYLDRLTSLDSATLSPRSAFSSMCRSSAVRDDLLLNDSMQVWKHQPDGYVQNASSGDRKSVV